MTDYYESRLPSRDLSYGEDPTADENAMRRTITRGSHQSHTSVSASTRSWVYSNQAHPPPPPDDNTPTPSPALTPLRRQRPLPDPQLHQARLAFQHAPHDAEEGYMHAYTNGAALHFGYQDGGPVEGMQIIPVPSSPGTDHLAPPTRRDRSFVGGFFSGLKRLPKLVLRGGGGKERQRLKRKGTFGTDHTEGTSTTATAITRGNTLPRYLSNPSIGPSNPQFAHRLSMAVANGSIPPDSTPAVFHVRSNPAGPQFPTVTVTPASADGIVGEEQADYYEGPSSDDRQYSEDSEQDRPTNERATVMVYSSDSQAPTVTQAPTGPPPPRQPTPGPRVSYQAQLPTRANAQAQTEFRPGPPPAASLHAPTPLRPAPPIQSPRSLHLPGEVLSSTQPTSNYTISAVPSAYDPSFASDLTPIEKFFKGLYNLPWIGHERVTVDYRPADSKRAQSKVRGLKKPMASWYRAVMSGSRRGSRNLDLLSDGTANSAGLSIGNTPSPLGSPISRRSGRSSNNNRHRSSKPKRHRRNGQRVTSSGIQVPHRTSSPIIPTSYPYTYPGYPYAYPYGAYPAMPVPHTSPRGPRSHRRPKAPKHPHGYTPYQPMAMPPQMAAPPPIYFISPSPPQSQSGGEGNSNPIAYAAPPGQMQVSPVIMQFVPGGFNQNPTMISPPLTPQRQAAFGS
ncbi:hypothetical protein GALMADRAFT_243603 [Galerina marginata CBS 339.88]|uniref:Uncharacterized protein n=1 Tax=Galerina marginata (strain CBS 339.88) TaxID=685588 RepID=A0A067THY3_GALM3|nr:hypothetical protein GALMADRAFT_243603 [Galerina marginata CBS 339.88]